MTTQGLYSVRMRASASSKHLSGAERLVPRDRIDGTVRDLVRRAMEKRLPPDQITVTIDALGGIPVRTVPSLDLTALSINDLVACRQTASDILGALGISSSAMMVAFNALDLGASPAGDNMRGAMLINASTGARIEPDRTRGVRVSQFDWSDEASVLIDRQLAELGLTHFRTREALALASKVAQGPGVIAELCWSDEPDYTAGYVASLTAGYVRLPQMKHAGNRFGGRAFFVNSSGFDRDALIAYLQGTPVLITSAGYCRAADRLPMPGRRG